MPFSEITAAVLMLSDVLIWHRVLLAIVSL